MAESETKKNGWGCRCCDGNDPKCQCLHHKFSGHMVLKKVLMLIILGLAFLLGVGVGKLSAFRELGKQGLYGYGFGQHGWHDNDWRMTPSYYPYGNNGYPMPMMNPRYWQNAPQSAASGATSTPSVK